MVALTKKNLEILKGLNDAFYTKRNHLAVVVGDETYVIPSFISLESKIESLENNLQNVMNAPLTGEAFTYFDGTTQRLELSGYSTTPNHVELNKITEFGTEINNIFKDFMNPNPFVKLDIASVPNNIKHVNVRKIAIYSDDLKNSISGVSNDGVVDFADVERILYGYDPINDYNQYDTIRRMPIRKGVAQGDYEIVNIIDNYQDSNFDEFYELELDRAPVYYINNGTIQKDIRVGDNLVTWNDKVMLEVHDVNPIRKSILVKVMYGAYADLQDKTSGNPMLYKLKYYKSVSDLSDTKYINVPLEEDEYVVIFVAPINDTTNTQAPWGKGVFIAVNELKMPDPNNPDVTIDFRTYYDQYVNNVGDSLVAITSMMDDEQQVSRLSGTQFDIIKNLQPSIDADLIKVTQINKHLNDSKSIKAIRNLYNQKNQYKSDLNDVQRQIDVVTKNLAELSFDDSTNSRTVYETQLAELNAQRSQLNDSIAGVMQEISVSANSSDTPIENAKYHIRGFVDVDLSNEIGIPDFVQVIKLEVQYRYKNRSSFTGNAETFGEHNYIFSDWNVMDSIWLHRVAKFENGRYKYEWEDNNDTSNNPSFNQVDIPITQGEIVDIRVRYIYNLGYPFAEVHSAWSDIYTQTFPDEFTQNVEILDIISENNDEIKTRHFENILEQKGVIQHLDDQLQDQTILYKHQAKNITSGFLTPERRVVPLADKLQDFNSDIEDLKVEVFGAASTNLIVTLADNNNIMQLKPNVINKFHTLSYKSAVANESTMRVTDQNEAPDDPMIAISQLTLNFYNNGSYNMRLHSLFPGAYDQNLIPDAPAIFDAGDYCGDEATGANPWMLLDDNSDRDIIQRFNQFLYFRTKLDDVVGNGDLYENFTGVQGFIVEDDNMLNGLPIHKPNGRENNILENLDISAMSDLRSFMMETQSGVHRLATIYPYPGSLNSICIPSEESFITIAPGESISIPVNFLYWFKEDPNSTEFRSAQNMRNLTVSRAMAFDIRTSLFQDPITFKFVVDASFEDSKGFKIKQANKLISGVAPLQSTVTRVSTPQTNMVKRTVSVRSNQ